MTIQEIQKIHLSANQCIDNAEVTDAFVHIKQLTDELGRGDMNDELERLRMSYTFMLKYLAQGVMDPQRDEILTSIRQSLYTLNDQCFIGLMEPLSPEVFYTRRRELGSTSLVGIVEEYRSAIKELSLVKSVPQKDEDNHVILSRLHHAEGLETKLFNRVWSSFPITTDDAGSLKLCISGDILPVHTRCLIVTALMLGLMKFYDESKLLILLEAYSLSDEPEVQLRALTCAMLAMLAHRKRTSSSKSIQTRLAALLDTPDFDRDVWGIQLQLARSRNTENVKQRVRNDLIPNIMKMRPDIIDKLKDKESQIIDLSEIEANPDWQEWLDQSGITRKIEEFNSMQIEGSDVFIATFAHLKTFPFFKTLSNWFLPFYPAHSAILENLGASKLALADVVQHAPYLCNSDKYSFVLAFSQVLGHLPQSILKLAEEGDALPMPLGGEVSAEEQRQPAFLRRACLQNLYRFFRLFSARDAFQNPFNLPDKYFNKEDMRRIFFFSNSLLGCEPMRDQYPVVARFLMKHHRYSEAVYVLCVMPGLKDDVQACLMMATALTRAAHYPMTLLPVDFLIRALELAPDNERARASLARHEFSSNRYKNAWREYDALSKDYPDNRSYRLNAAVCLVHLRRIDEALPILYEFNYLDADDMDDCFEGSENGRNTRKPGRMFPKQERNECKEYDSDHYCSVR